MLQVGTGTGIMTHYFNLFVIVPTAVISGSDEYHTPEGNSIVLCCKVENVSIVTNVKSKYLINNDALT